MKNRFVISRIALLVGGLILCGAPAVWAAVTELDGQVVSVDLEKQQLKVKDTHEHVVTLQIGRETTISSPVSSKLVLKDLKENDKVHAYYTTADKKARQIDVAPTLPVIHDLESR